MDTELQHITLPLEVFDGRFTLEQVGAIAILMAIPNMTKENVTHWGNDAFFMPIVNGLVASKHATVSPNGDGSVKLELDLT